MIGADALTGLVTFPSFHACAALLFTWAVAPIRGARAVTVTLNAAMLVATPFCGAHYLVDVIAGLALGAGALAVSRAILAGYAPAQRASSVCAIA